MGVVGGGGERDLRSAGKQDKEDTVDDPSGRVPEFRQVCYSKFCHLVGTKHDSDDAADDHKTGPKYHLARDLGVVDEFAEHEVRHELNRLEGREYRSRRKAKSAKVEQRGDSKDGDSIEPYLGLLAVHLL